MDTSVAAPPATDPNTAPAATVPGVPSGPGWLVLRDCPLGGGGPPVGLALLHPKIGVALVDFAPTAVNAADRLRRELDVRRFPAIFGAYPPVVWTVLPEDRLSELGHTLAAGFRAEPHFALQGDDAWVSTARAALEAKPRTGRPAAHRERRREVPPWQAAVFILGAAAAGASAAAVVAVMPPGRGPADAPGPATTAAAPRPARPQPEIPLTATEFRPAPAAAERTAAELRPAPPPPAEVELNHSAVELRPAPEADAAAGADTDFAALPMDAGDGPAPVAGDDLAETPAPTEAAGPVESAVGAAADLPLPVPPGAASPDPPDAAGEQPPRPTRTAGLADAPARAAPLAPPPTADRRATSPLAPPTAAVPFAETATGRRCRDILVKTTLGERLSNGDKEHLRHGCQQPRN
jgi:hypothetical protein